MLLFNRRAGLLARLSIRPLERSDAPAVFDAIEESRLELSRWMDWCRPTYSFTDTEAWLEAVVEGREDGTSHHFGVFDGARFLGCCGVSVSDPLARVANLGYWVRTSAAGLGVATEGSRRAVEWCLRHTDIERIEILAATGNLRSQRVAEKLGAVREGLLRSRLAVFDRRHDAVIYSVLRSDLERDPAAD